ncbi:MAG: glycosyltransferase family 9 protein [Fimbriimonas sp.]
MRRYLGEALPERARIAVIANDALGNYVVSTPLLQMLRAKYPSGKLDYYSGTRVRELWQHDTNVDQGFPLFGGPPYDSIKAQPNPYDLVINIEQLPWAKCFAAAISGPEAFVCGPSLGLDGRDDLPFPDDERGQLARDREWIASDLTKKYPFLQSGFIGEIFCRLAYLEGPVPPYKVPSTEPEGEVPDVLIATAASLPEKLWPVAKWIESLEAIRKKGQTVGLIGAKPKEQKQFWQGGSGEEELVASCLVEDLRGKYKLTEVVGALAKAKQVLTLDNGILHMAVSTGTPTVGLYRHGIHRLWAPPYKNLTVLTPGEGKPVEDITVDQVLDAL